jgi:hypothetical protein
MFNKILQVFAEKSPVTVMVHGLLERFLNANKIDNWFESVSETQYTRKILFSSILGIMLQVVCRVRSNVHSAYLNSNINASRIALYAKLQNMELNTSRELVLYSATQAEELIGEMKACNEPMLPGYRIKFLDGNCIESTEHRIKALQETEDGHAQERSLLSPVLETLKPKDLIVADRNFCVQSFLFGISNKASYFIIRQHKSMPYKLLSDKVFIGETETGKVYQEEVLLTYDGQEIKARRVIL